LSGGDPDFEILFSIVDKPDRRDKGDGPGKVIPRFLITFRDNCSDGEGDVLVRATDEREGRGLETLHDESLLYGRSAREKA